MKLRVANRLLIFTAFVCYLSVLAGYCFWDYQYQRRVLLGSIDAELYKSAAALKYILPEDLHDRAANSESLAIEEDEQEQSAPPQGNTEQSKTENTITYVPPTIFLIF